MTALPEKFGLERPDLPFLELNHRHATWVEPEELGSPASHDPSDDWVLATAVAGQAAVVVTGDDDLLSLGSFGSVEIITPRQVLERYGGDAEKSARERTPLT